MFNQATTESLQGNPGIRVDRYSLLPQGIANQSCNRLVCFGASLKPELGVMLRRHQAAFHPAESLSRN
jgi:hypothetical protein